MTSFTEKRFCDLFIGTLFVLWNHDIFPARTPKDWLECQKISEIDAIEIETGIIIPLPLYWEVFIEEVVE